MVLGLRERWLVVRKSEIIGVLCKFILVTCFFMGHVQIQRIWCETGWWILGCDDSGSPMGQKVSSVQILMSCIGLTWYRPVLFCYNRSFQTTCSLTCCSVKGAQEFHLVTSFCYRSLTLWIRAWGPPTLDLPERLPQNQNLSVLLFHDFHQLFWH